MILQPTAIEAFMKSSTSAPPLPTIVPGYTLTKEQAGDVGNRTLWYGYWMLMVYFADLVGSSVSSWASPPSPSTGWHSEFQW